MIAILAVCALEHSKTVRFCAASVHERAEVLVGDSGHLSVGLAFAAYLAVAPDVTLLISHVHVVITFCQSESIPFICPALFAGAGHLFPIAERGSYIFARLQVPCF